MCAYSAIEFARKYLVVQGIKCGRHCEREARFAILIDNGKELIGAYVDPENYVSRVVYFSPEADETRFESFLRNQVGSRLRKRDLRFGTRHGWELGQEAEKEARTALKERGITEYYWTFYPKNDDDRANGTFLCSFESGGCGKRLFVKPLKDDKKICEQCASLKSA